jgi:hypothetical protein
MLPLRHQLNSLWLIAFLAMMGGASSAAPVPRTADPLNIQAAYLVAISRYTEWPETAFAEASSPIVVGLLGESDLGTLLKRTVIGKTAGGRKIKIREIKGVEEVAGLHILYLPESKKELLAPVLEALKGRAVMTFSEVDDFMKSGGAIQFLRARPFVSFGVNLDATDAAGLKIESKVMDIARRTLIKGRIRSR